MYMQDKAFLDKLTNLAREYGWSGDHHEIAEFVMWCYKVYGLIPPSKKQLEPVEK